MKRVSILVPLIAFILFSCQKEISLENPGTLPPTAPADSVLLLKKFIILDTTQAAPADTMFIYNYSYDNLKRCTQITVNDYQNNSIGYTYNYYNGSDTLIASRRLINQVYADSLVQYFTYHSNGQMLSDSILTYNPSLVPSKYKYSIVGNTISSAISFSAQPFLLGKYIITTDSYGNVVQEKDSAFQYVAGTYSYSNHSNVSMTYDNHPCPFFNNYPKRLTGMEYEMAAIDDVPFYQFLQKNNTKTRLAITLPLTTGFGNWSDSYQYSYNSNNYPVTVIYKDLAFGEIFKGMYYY